MRSVSELIIHNSRMLPSGYFLVVKVKTTDTNFFIRLVYTIFNDYLDSRSISFVSSSRSYCVMIICIADHNFIILVFIIKKKVKE